MENKTIISTPLGSLIVLDVYYYYDIPRLFSCESLSGQKYISVWVDEEDNFDRWFLIPVSNKRLEMVHIGMLSLYEAIKSPEDGWIWELKTYFDNTNPTIKMLKADEINPEDLPDKNVRFSKSGGQLQKLDKEPIVTAQRTKRDVIDVSINTKGTHIQEIDADDLAKPDPVTRAF